MKNILMLIIMSFIFLGNGGLSEHVLTDLKDVVLYCNTKDFVKTMVKESYHMHLAADGLVPDEKHKHLYKMQL